jgi:Zn-dependent protease with chaperone function
MLRFAEQLDIVEDGETIASWPYGDIRRADGFELLRLSSISALPLARLEVEDHAAEQKILNVCVSLEDAASSVRTWRIVAWSLAAAGSIVLMTLFGIPFAADRIAPIVPAAYEKRLGDAVDKQVQTMMGGKVCDRPEGQSAFAKMVQKLQGAGGGIAEPEAQVLASIVPNAIALPGGRIYLFDGLLQKANNPDEIAGVIAHEIGHAHNRDGLRNLIRTGGTSFLIGLLFGDITGSGAVIFASRALLDASHSREAETGADDYAVAAMTKLGRSPVPMGELLVRVTRRKGSGTIIDSHPVSAQRLERFRQSDRPVAGEPILDDEEWRALKQICSKPAS